MPSSNKVLVRLAAAASALALGACAAVGPNFKSPEPPAGAAAAGYAMVGEAAAPRVSLSPDARTAGPWWQAFGSPELDATVRQALADSPTLAEANAKLERARAEAAAAAGRRLPEADLDASAKRERINIQALGFAGFANPTVSLYSVGGSVDYDLDLFGGKRRASEQAAAAAEAEGRRADAAYLTLSGNVVLQALKVASLKAQIAAVQAVIDDDQRVIDMTRNATRAGGRAPSDIVGGHAQLAEDQVLLPPLQRDLAIARHQLALLSGKAPAEWSPPDFDLGRLTAPQAIPLALPSALVRGRPDIRAAEAELHAATAAIGVAVAAQYPDVSLSGSFTQTSIHPGNLVHYSASGWNVGPALSLPIFRGGALRADRRAAEADARAATARYQQTVLRAFVQVSDVLAALASDQQSIEALTRALRASEASAHDAETSYRLGGGNLLQVTDAQRQLSRARRALIQAQGQQFTDLAELFAATATDWRPAATTT
jgi:NodT family efflux transporter outer membrane factor (OMF) lipoprotein